MFQIARNTTLGFGPKGSARARQRYPRRRAHSMAFAMSSTTFFASPNTIMVLSM
jgi:hypothetical protein